jgi:cell division protein FtsQ
MDGGGRIMSKIAAKKLPQATPKKRRKIAEDALASRQRDARQRSYNWRRRLAQLRRLLVLGVLAVVAYSGWFVWQQGYAAQIGMITNTLLVEVPTIPTLRVARVEISGTRNISRASIREVTGDLTGMPILNVPLDDIRANITALGWVEDVTILRSLPGTIRISITERQPYAIWQQGGILHLIDRSGAEIKRNDLQAFTDLPLIVGLGAPDQAAELMDVLVQQPALWAQVHAVVRVGQRRWDLKFNNGIEVMLPEQNVADAWSRLATLERDHAILSRDVAVLDLRLADRLTVRPTENQSSLKTSSTEDM